MSVEAVGKMTNPAIVINIKQLIDTRMCLGTFSFYNKK